MKLKKVRRSRRSFGFRFAVLLLAVAIGMVMVDMKMRPIIQTMAINQAKAIATRTINNTVAGELLKEDISYANIVTIDKDKDGKVSAVKTDITKINVLKARMTSAIQEALSSLQDSSIRVAVGNFLGWDALTGWGPKISMKLAPAGNVTSRVDNVFDSAGLNQTRHQIMLNIIATVVVIIPGYTVSSEVSANFCIAESIIVGAVPNSFTNIEDPQGSDPSNILQYSGSN